VAKATRVTWAVRGGVLALAAAGVAFLYVVATVPPSDATYYPRCQIHSLTGLHCPGCGTTRALHALLNGHVLDALGYNVLFPFVLPAVAWAFVRSLRVARGLTPDALSAAERRGFRVLAVAVVLYAVLRNVPTYPFTLLAPGGL
jgi:hypothetical protein